MAVYSGILKDATATWPQSTKRFEQDLSCLRRACEQRGLSFFTITLPDLGKVIDRSLEEGYFLASEVPLGIPMIKKRPELFGDLYMKLFNECGTLREDLDPTALFFFRQLCFTAKKLEIECSKDKVEEALAEFFDIERDLPKPIEDTWDADAPQWRPRHGHPLQTVDTRTEGENLRLDLGDQNSDPSNLPWDSLRLLSNRVILELGTPDFWSLRPKHGPGAVSENQKGVIKYDFPYWPRKLGLLFPFDWFGSGSLDPDYHPNESEPASRLIAVPKTQKGPRLICAEPIAHQWMQQSIWRWLEDRVRKTVLGHSITFRSQENSRDRALQASLDRNNCTIDLSSASDRVSCRLVEYLFQGNYHILDAFHATRTRLMKQGISTKFDTHVKLRKFSTQGSSLTFPVESIVFTILTVWALRLSEGRENDFTNWKGDFERVTVFGDDIIAPSTAYDAILTVLSECGLKVNRNKSFMKGFFRESCGVDAYKGYNVTPSYLLRPYTGTPESTVSLLITANNFHASGLWNAAEAVILAIPYPQRKLLPVLRANSEDVITSSTDVTRDSGHLGLLSFNGSKFSHLRRVWNDSLHRWERCVFSITSKVKRVHGRDDARLTQFFHEWEERATDNQSDWKSGQPGRVTLGKRVTRVAFLIDVGGVE